MPRQEHSLALHATVQLEQALGRPAAMELAQICVAVVNQTVQAARVHLEGTMSDPRNENRLIRDLASEMLQLRTASGRRKPREDDGPEHTVGCQLVREKLKPGLAKSFVTEMGLYKMLVDRAANHSKRPEERVNMPELRRKARTEATDDLPTFEHLQPADILQTLDTQLNLALGFAVQKDFTDVRAATYRRLEVKDLPLVKASYMKHLLKTGTIEDAINGERKKVREATRKGVFVFDPDEKPDGKPSVMEQMEADMKGGRYVVYGLFGPPKEEGGDEELYAYASWYRMMNDDHHVEQVKHALQYGTTGQMHYDPQYDFQSKFMAEAANILMFDTISSNKPYAAERLIYECISTMVAEHGEKCRTIILYILRGLNIVDEHGRLVTEEFLDAWKNMSSVQFFSSIGFLEFVRDFCETGPRSQRELNVDNIRGAMRAKMPFSGRVFGLPGWTWLHANTADALEQATRRVTLTANSMGYEQIKTN